MSNERQYTTTLLKALRAEPDVWVFKVHGGSMQQAGLPDIIGCINGRFFAVEVKKLGNTPTPLQARTLKDIEQVGARTTVAYTYEPVEEVLQWLRSFA